MENFIAIKFLNPRFVEALNMWGPRLPRRAAGPVHGLKTSSKYFKISDKMIALTTSRIQLRTF